MCIYFRFPAGQEITKKWIEIVRRNRQDKNWMPNKYSTLCSSHFQNGDIITSKKGLQRVLRRGAFPTKVVICNIFFNNFIVAQQLNIAILVF